MEPFTTLTATALPVDTPNVDTDQIIPARFLRKPWDEKCATYLFHDLRFNEDGSEKPDFILHQAPYRDSRILVGELNFGCGSSREHAVVGLATYGFRAVIAPSFGDIFFNNCFKHGVLPIRLNGETCKAIRAQLHADPGAGMTVDLDNQKLVGPDGAAYDFEVEPFRKHCLLNGLDDILLTLEYEKDIAAFEGRSREEMSWLFQAPA